METKHWLDSTTIRAVLLGAVPAVYSLSRTFGLDFPDGLLEDAVNGISSILMIVSLVGAFLGRLKADKPISLGK